MLSLLSPAKTLDFESPVKTGELTRPELLADAKKVARICKNQTPQDLQELMGISEKLAELNHARFQDWSEKSSPDARPAALAFQGDVYQGLQANTLTGKQLEYAQDHLRILSGLYGVLRPLDAMLPYRLEMGTSLANDRGKDLYAFWGDRVTNAINAQLKVTKSAVLLNLASNEYFRVLQKRDIESEIVSPAFKEMKNGKYKIISFFAKKARGTMAAWVIRKKVKTPKKLIQFAEDGYRHSPELSTEQVPVFVRG